MHGIVFSLMILYSEKEHKIKMVLIGFVFSPRVSLSKKLHALVDEHGFMEVVIEGIHSKRLTAETAADMQGNQQSYSVISSHAV